ncbi:MAG TPA: L-threonylcarbamoyladenylate synthase [Thermoleophilaceae bacterium]|nr:L-threonylcarbamoyladenylate synthase [Thermoleophilaceae bacterium]
MTFEDCVRSGGIALFPADTVYGLAVDPENEDAIERMYRLKGRPREKKSALMYFLIDAVPDLPDRARKLLPGPITVILADGRGIRVPDQPLLAGVGIPVLQTSANPSGGPDPRRLEDVDPAIRAGVDLEIDGGELPGTPSTVVDLSGEEVRIVREGAMSAEWIRALLQR